MSEARTAREVLIALALSEIDALLSRIESAEKTVGAQAERLEETTRAIETASMQYATEMQAITAATKGAAVAFVERKVTAATASGIEQHRKAMQDAATLAFAQLLAPAVRDIARQVEQHRSELTHARQRLAPHAATFGCGVFFGALLATALFFVQSIR